MAGGRNIKVLSSDEAKGKGEIETKRDRMKLRIDWKKMNGQFFREIPATFGKVKICEWIWNSYLKVESVHVYRRKEHVWRMVYSTENDIQNLSKRITLSSETTLRVLDGVKGRDVACVRSIDTLKKNVRKKRKRKRSRKNYYLICPCR